MADYKIYNSDCIKAMKKLDADSINLIITDPPYNLGKFMENRDTNLKKMRGNFFGAAGWDDMDFESWANSMNDLSGDFKVLKKESEEDQKDDVTKDSILQKRASFLKDYIFVILQY